MFSTLTFVTLYNKVSVRHYLENETALVSVENVVIVEALAEVGKCFHIVLNQFFRHFIRLTTQNFFGTYMSFLKFASQLLGAWKSATSNSIEKQQFLAAQVQKFVRSLSSF
ncbi:unnamed protein product, partial [Dicrocoelium dendriticum]